MTATPAEAQFSIGVSVNFAPPALPVYAQPPIPGPDYIWTPGYWAWDDMVQDYFWIPGTWLLAPRAGLLWTPPWWGWQNGAYLFHSGYWGPHVGFYGGVAYGFGYTGVGFQGAYWSGPHLFYNRSVTNITNVNVINIYNKTVVVNHINQVSYNGGPGGIQARPSAFEQAAMHEQHVAPTPLQQQHFQAARANRQLFASANGGRPPVAATARPAQFHGPGVTPARAAPPFHPMQPQGRQDDLGAGRAKMPQGAAQPVSRAQQLRQPAPGSNDDVRSEGRFEQPAPEPFQANRMEAARPPQSHQPGSGRPSQPRPPSQHQAPPPPHPHGGQPHPPGGGHPKAPHEDNHHHD